MGTETGTAAWGLAGMLAESLVRELEGRGLTVTTVESCTGGMVSAAVTSVPGSSHVLKEARVTYCDDAKHRLAGVWRRTLRRHTAVSREAAGEMAAGGAKRARADLALSVTGYAGPASGDEAEETGLVYIGCAYRGNVRIREFHFSGDRQCVRLKACAWALRLALQVIRTDGAAPSGR